MFFFNLRLSRDILMLLFRKNSVNNKWVQLSFKLFYFSFQKSLLHKHTFFCKNIQECNDLKKHREKQIKYLEYTS